MGFALTTPISAACEKSNVAAAPEQQTHKTRRVESSQVKSRREGFQENISFVYHPFMFLFAEAPAVILPSTSPLTDFKLDLK